MKQTMHVLPDRGKWIVKGEGAKRASSSHNTQKEALARAKEIAAKKKSEVVLHYEDGRIETSDFFPNHPDRRLKENR
jgi:uncharacterized protein YdaT